MDLVLSFFPTRVNIFAEQLCNLQVFFSTSCVPYLRHQAKGDKKISGLHGT